MSSAPATVLDYSSSDLPVRPVMLDAQARMLTHLVSPGTWWTGHERREIAKAARAARDCALCAERKAALSPFAVDGEHGDPSDLAPGVVDLVHRIVTDPGRLSKGFYEKCLADGIVDPEHYAELVSISVLTNALDVFARAIGAEIQPLPQALAGEPSRQRPKSARIEGAWLPQIPFGEAGGEDWKTLYGERERVPEIGRALSLVPPEVEMLNLLSAAHYMQLDHVGDPTYSEPDRALDRLQMELVAARVSAINECFY